MRGKSEAVAVPNQSVATNEFHDYCEICHRKMTEWDTNSRCGKHAAFELVRTIHRITLTFETNQTTTPVETMSELFGQFDSSYNRILRHRVTTTAIAEKTSKL